MDVTPVWFRSQAKTVNEPGELPEDAPLEQRVIAAMRTVYDPEISVNIYDLGLIYDIQIGQQAGVFVKMTLTAPGCPVAGILPAQVESAIRAVDGVSDARVELVWDPPWSQDCMSDEARLTLGLF
jgi:FeS assembly SUF system protein